MPELAVLAGCGTFQLQQLQPSCSHLDCCVWLGSVWSTERGPRAQCWRSGGVWGLWESWHARPPWLACCWLLQRPLRGDILEPPGGCFLQGPPDLRLGTTNVWDAASFRGLRLRLGTTRVRGAAPYVRARAEAGHNSCPGCCTALPTEVWGFQGAWGAEAPRVLALGGAARAVRYPRGAAGPRGAQAQLIHVLGSTLAALCVRRCGFPRTLLSWRIVKCLVPSTELLTRRFGCRTEAAAPIWKPSLCGSVLPFIEHGWKKCGLSDCYMVSLKWFKQPSKNMGLLSCDLFSSTELQVKAADDIKSHYNLIALWNLLCIP